MPLLTYLLAAQASQQSVIIDLSCQPLSNLSKLKLTQLHTHHNPIISRQVVGGIRYQLVNNCFVWSTNWIYAHQDVWLNSLSWKQSIHQSLSKNCIVSPPCFAMFHQWSAVLQLGSISISRTKGYAGRFDCKDAWQTIDVWNVQPARQQYQQILAKVCHPKIQEREDLPWKAERTWISWLVTLATCSFLICSQQL